MKIAVGIISLMLGLLVMLQSCAVGTASHMLGEEAASEAGAMGLFAGLLLFFGGAFAFGLPLVSACLFTLAGLIALLGAAEVPDLSIWAIMAFVLAGLSFFAWRSGKRKTTSLGSNASA